MLRFLFAGEGGGVSGVCVWGGRRGGEGEGGRVLLTKDWRLDMAFGVDGGDVVRVDGRGGGVLGRGAAGGVSWAGACA